MQGPRAETLPAQSSAGRRNRGALHAPSISVDAETRLSPSHMSTGMKTETSKPTTQTKTVNASHLKGFLGWTQFSLHPWGVL